VYYGDERCVPPEDGERNSLMVARAWLDHVPIPAEQTHSIPAELGAAEGAAAYCAVLENVGTFDLVLLGLGEDAHTASLFPGHTWDHSPPIPAIPVKHAPKPPSERVSMSASRLSDARKVIFLVAGAGKRRAVSQWRGSLYIPVKAITPAAGVDIFLDAAAGETP
jgi:6-phosphogluconolactonase